MANSLKQTLAEHHMFAGQNIILAVRIKKTLIMQVLHYNKMYQQITQNKHSHNFFGSSLLVNGQNKTSKPNLQNAAKVGGQAQSLLDF